ncbi:hypothetical protein ACA910_007978 [Epithemia clementina (nom. ined.)]
MGHSRKERNTLCRRQSSNRGEERELNPPARRRLEIPLLDVSSSTFGDGMVNSGRSNKDKKKSGEMILALPGSHLPDAFASSLNVYVMDMNLPIQKTIIEATMERGGPFYEGGDVEYCFGQVVHKRQASFASSASLLEDSDNLVGAIGCVVQILSPSLTSLEDSVGEEGQQQLQTQTGTGDGATPSDGGTPQSVLCRGLYRFIVREIKQTVPFVIAVVDELVDNEKNELGMSGDIVVHDDLFDEDDDDEDDEDLFDDYDSLNPSQLEQRLMQGLHEYVDQQLAAVVEKQDSMSPLERSLLERSGGPGGVGGINIQREAAEETAALLQVFQHYVVDELSAATPRERWFALSFFAAELTDVNASTRQTMLRLTNGVERLRLITQQVEETVRMGRARKVAKSVTDQTDEMQRDLQVGRPQLPPKSVFGKGTTVEYFWNEEFGWCEGVVVEDPELAVDDGTGEEIMLLTVYFDDDGTTHQIPFRPEEKARWRPTRRRQ